MNFFEQQAATRRRSARLIALLVLVIVCVIAGAYWTPTPLLGRIYGNDENGHLVERSDSPRKRWGPLLGGGFSLAALAIIGLASLYKWSQLRTGGSAIAAMVGGRPADPNSPELPERRLLNIVEEMAIASGIPVPNVYILDEELTINAFAAGFTTSDAVVTVTRGALEKLSRAELEGVIAHEFSHILNGDMQLNLRLTSVLFGLLAFGLFAKRLVAAVLGARAQIEEKKRGRTGTIILNLLTILLLPWILIVMCLALLLGTKPLVLVGMSYFLGRRIQSAVSRQREFLADASAVQFTRHPDSIAGALKRIRGDTLGSILQTSRAPEIAHFLFVQSARSNHGIWGDTHPPLEERIRAIEPHWDGKFPLTSTRRASWGNNDSESGSPQNTAVLSSRPPITAAALLASVGLVTSAHLDRARQLLAALPPRLATAARAPAEALSVVFALLLASDPATRTRQLDTLRVRHGQPFADAFTALAPAADGLAPELRLPLLDIALPALRTLPPAEISGALETVRLLIEADGEVTLFEFMLEKALDRHVAAPARGDRQGVVNFYSFGALQDEIGLLLSALSRVGSESAQETARAFAAAGARIPPLQGKLQLLPATACTLAAISTALDKLVQATPAIRKVLLLAGTEAIASDGTVEPDEADLLRAVADALDCPIPPLLSAADKP